MPSSRTGSSGRGLGPVVPLAKEHVVSAFDCGSVAVTMWLRRHGLQAHQSGSSRVYVATEGDSARVQGFHALAAGSVGLADVPSRVGTGLGRHPIPVVVLTRLGVDRSAQGLGLGTALLRDALLRVNRAADVIGVRALLVHAESDDARAFYLHLAEFEPSPTDPLHLLLLLKDLRRALE